MAGKQLKRFEKWRAQLPARTAYFVQLVLDEVVPVLEADGFVRHADYAGDSAEAVARHTIALQRRSGTAWPTVEISFDKRSRPMLGLTFALLPEPCYRQGTGGGVEIARIAANVVEGDAYFNLGKEHGFIVNFGYWFALLPQRRARREIDHLKALLPFLLSLLDGGLPPDWVGQVGKVHPNVFANRGARQLARLSGSVPG